MMWTGEMFKWISDKGDKVRGKKTVKIQLKRLVKSYTTQIESSAMQGSQIIRALIIKCFKQYIFISATKSNNYY